MSGKAGNSKTGKARNLKIGKHFSTIGLVGPVTYQKKVITSIKLKSENLNFGFLDLLVQVNTVY